MNSRFSNKANRHGVIAPLMALLFPVFLLLCGIVVNIAYMQLNRTELRVATDASARASGNKPQHSSRDGNSAPLRRHGADHAPEELEVERLDLFRGTGERGTSRRAPAHEPGLAQSPQGSFEGDPSPTG